MKKLVILSVFLVGCANDSYYLKPSSIEVYQKDLKDLKCLDEAVLVCTSAVGRMSGRQCRCESK